MNAASPEPRQARAAPASAERLMKLATTASVAVAGTLIGAKFFAWFATDSVSILSTLIDSLLDAVASLLNLMAVRHALTPADREHRFGHGKAEPLAALGQSAFIAGYVVADRLVGPPHPDPHAPGADEAPLFTDADRP